MEADDITLSDVAEMLEAQAGRETNRDDHLSAMAYGLAAVRVREIKAQLDAAIKSLKGE